MKRMLIDAAHANETRMVILKDDRVEDYDFVTSSKAQIKGNIYLAKITRVEPSLQAAFVEYGGGKQGFLPFSEIHPDYYQLPQEDRQKLLEEQIAEAEAEEAAEDEAFEREQAARESRRHFRDEEGEENEDTEGAGDSEETLPTHVDTGAPASGESLLTDGAEGMNAAADPSAAAPLPTVESFTPPQPALSALPDEISLTTEYAPLSSASYEAYSDVLPEDSAAASLAPGAPMGIEEGAAASESEIATSAEDAEETRHSTQRNVRGFHRRYRIGEVIKRNQIILVQVIKEERGNKGCSLTTFISLAGRCAVLMPNSPKGGGISRKITDRETRRRLKEIASEMRTHRGMSVIIRTAGLDRTRAEIRRDYEYLVKLWNEVRSMTLSSSAPALIYEEGNLVKRALRDQFTSDIEEVIIEGETAFEEAKNFMQMLMPSHVSRIKFYKETMPLFSFAGVEEQLLAMTEPQVKLPSGGYLVIHPTEALISIDVNSGRSTTERNVEETAVKTNLEAAAEIGRQLRLRDLAGLIVVDFIDMNYGKNRKSVERAMKDALRNDRAKISMGRISMFGLLELSRQRMRPSIAESMGVLCPHCRGTGYVHSVETVGIQIVRALEKEAASREYAALRITTTPEAALYLLNDKRPLLQSIEQRYQVSVVILMDAGLLTSTYRLVKVTQEGKEVQHENGQQSNSSRRGGARRRGRRGGGEGGANGRVLDFSDAVEEAQLDPSADIGGEEGDDEVIVRAEPTTDDSSRGESGRRRRGGRNRRGGRGRDGRDRDRERRNPEERSTPLEGESPAEEWSGAEAPGADTAGESPREGRGGRRRHRGRRGGRSRAERSAPESQGAAESSDPYTESFMEPAAAPLPKSSTASYPTPSAPPMAQSAIVSLSEAQTNPLAMASPIRSEDSGAESSKPKRKGWWARVLVD